MRNFRLETIIGDILDAQADLGGSEEVSSLKSLMNASESELLTFREQLWIQAYPMVSAKWEDRFQAVATLDFLFS